MTSILPFVIALFVLLAIAVFFWIWWSAPQDQVPPHLSEGELRRLEVQDRLRQTNFQILTALGLGATFIATVFQLAMTSRQWSQDFQLKTVQERIGQYSDALKAITESGPPQISGIGSLSNLALQDPDGYQQQVNEVLSSLVRQNAINSPMETSQECSGVTNAPYARGEAKPEVQAAMTALGNRKFASYRDKFVSGACESWSGKISGLVTLRLDHQYLDEVDLSGRDLSCAGLSQAQLHIVSFNDAILRGTDFRGARIADFETPQFTEQNIQNNLYVGESKGGPPEWKLYRCLVTDFRNADLTGADFGGAAVAGADFSGADLTGANFCRTDISRANFTNAKGLKKEMLLSACVGKGENAPDSTAQQVDIDTEAQPFGVPASFGEKFAIPRCRTDYADKKCPSN